MSDRNEELLSVTFGLDVSDRTTELCRISADGALKRESLRTTPEAFAARFRTESRARIVLEAGTHSPWMYWLLKELGHEALVVQPRKLALITHSLNKTDRGDAELLARLGRVDLSLLSPIHVRPRDKQAHLTLLRARDLLVAQRTTLINGARGLCKPFGVRLPSCGAEVFPKKVLGTIPSDLLPALTPLIELIGALTQSIRALDRQVEELGKQRHPEAATGRQVKGVGPLLSTRFVLTLDDPGRFKRSREVGPYLGLAPKRRSSGERDPQLGITKAGDKDLRRLLVLASHYILSRGPDTDLQRFGRARLQGGAKNARKRAVVAVARKLAVLLHRLWVTGKAYQPLLASSHAASPDQAA